MIANYLSERRNVQLADAKALIAQDVIYNVDFIGAKENLGRIFDDLTTEIVRKPFFYGMGNNHNVPEAVVALYDKQWAAHLAPSLLKHTNKVVSDHPCHVAMMDLLNEFAPIMVAFKEAKGKVVKGRKPSTTPRTTPERTIENTGTCGCCGKNVKLSGGRLVAHGFTIKYGFQSGNCFGVGYEPVEVSSKAMVEYVMVLKLHVENQERLLAEDNFENYNEKRNVEFSIRSATADTKYFEKRIESWGATSLPGTK